MIIDTDRINFLCQNRVLKIEEVQKSGLNDAPFKYEMFTIETQRFYGDSIRDLIDCAISGEYKKRRYYGEEWLKRTKVR